jgi:putative membrane protein
MGRILGFLILVLIMLFALVFSALNTAPVTIDYYLGKLEIPSLSIALAIALLFGVLLGIIASLGIVLRTRGELLKLRKEVKNTEKEVMNLRNMPIKDTH